MTAEWVRFKNTCVWSWDGWCASWKSEKTLRQWTLVNLLSAGLTFAVDMSSVERILIVGFGMLVLVAELLNTAVENTVDRISLDPHPMSKKAKDAGSAAVAATVVTAGVIWLLVLFG
nr:diacylglycerol kinase [Cochlodiniinecator piscidefendens]